MRIGRLIAVASVVAVAGAGALYALAPEAHGQAPRKVEKKVIKTDKDDFHMATLGDGSEIGVSVRDVDSGDVTRHKLTGQSGAVVEEVRSETPAAKAGLKSGDVIVAFDGERVRSARQLERLVDETPAGRAVKMSIVRDGAKVDVDVTPEASRLAWAAPKLTDELARKHADELRDEALDRLRDKKFDRFSMPAFEFDWDEGPFAGRMRGRLGVMAEALTDQLATYFGVESGVLVRSVTDDSPAAKAGVKAGDVITAVNGKAVKDAEDLRRTLADTEDGKTVTLSVTRDKKPLSLTATIEPPQESRSRIRRTV